MPANFYPLPDSSNASLPIHTRQPTHARQPTRHGTTVKRAKTLVKPERSVAPAPLINPPTMPGSQAVKFTDPSSSWDTWRIFSMLVTFWAPPVFLKWARIPDRPSQQAWREKVALCFIALVIGACVGFLTMGLDRVLCPTTASIDLSRYSKLGSEAGTLGIDGWQFNISAAISPSTFDFYAFSAQQPGQDITPYFQRGYDNFPACQTVSARFANMNVCNGTTCPLGYPNASTFGQYNLLNTSLIVGYDWGQVANITEYMVIDGDVLNMQPYLQYNPTPIPNDPVDAALRTILLTMPGTSGRDATMMFYSRANLKNAVPCLKERYYAGSIDKITAGCFISMLFLYTSLVMILGIVLTRFAMACIFNWFISAELVKPPRNLSRTVISPAVMPEGANVTVDNETGTAPWTARALKKGNKLSKPSAKTSRPSSPNSMLRGPAAAAAVAASQPLISAAQIGAELYTVCLVTCYSENEASIRGTLDSIAGTQYSDKRKLLFIVCDGMVTGSGERTSTPDMCVGMLEADERFGDPMPLLYGAVGTGEKRENRAMVYAGHYVYGKHRTPTLIIVKCGMEKEMNGSKPGNRGKRDSQLILMNFFSRVTYNDRMTPLDFDMFRKMQVLMGVTPDFFELCLMVDADTRVDSISLKQLVNCMHHDRLIMGVCGETRLANKRQSWVTMIQVYEYFISHHLAKAFESVFGGVTCLPGCFSMYRLKARKSADDDWVPLLCKPEIVRDYSQSDVTTLHQKNLLLLGEDRFLTTVLLRTFPNRKMIFCPQAKCHTVAPDKFSVLLSQRRRWINSTVHNLMELVRVRNLCGTFCFSMQFVVFMDLIGTAVLPVSICLTYTLIVNMILDPPNSFEKAIPLMLLIAVLGLPAILILITTRKFIYCAWMLIYLLALPIWNFVLPVYAFWHFDDFSWGETRKVEGELKMQSHGGITGTHDGTSVPLRRWEDWERSRLRKLKRDERRRKEFERMQFGMHLDPFSNVHAINGNGNGNGIGAPFQGREVVDDGYDSAMSDTVSIVSSNEDDQWGTQIGGYNENSAQYAPPPITFGAEVDDHFIREAKTVGKEELEAMLEEGFDDRPANSGFSPTYRVPPVPSLDSKYFVQAPPAAQRYRLEDNPAYKPMKPVGEASAVRSTGHARQRSGAAGKPHYGPLGPLDPGGGRI
ncbi:glycosyltransferase family 2 protein [Calocera viscosa TUFC12733]|uniref:chitin synthase n=1 Tax=Calocera viscosa (strain TUFC12733) TaxID=1330018 RepID=A0A167PK50_CALVF|nr:glycosyltransferase family 2 protein [Calocera viscosa TUFC12733]